LSTRYSSENDVYNSSKAYDLLFAPKSIAVLGASNDSLKPGGRVIKTIKNHGYKGELFAINPKTASILGLPTFASVADLPKAPDLAIIAIPAPYVLGALEELALKGVGATIVLTSGFGEKDEQGKIEEQKMLEIAQKAGMVLVGPNCSGFMTHCYKGKFAGLVPDLDGRVVDFISGSGATVDYLMEQATLRGLSFGNVVNVGNSVQMGVEDLVALWDENYGPDYARILLIYMELMKKPQKLLYHARSLARKGCILIGIKSGVTAAGQRAAASHTGAMATSDTAVQALFDKAGIIRVKSKMELIDAACILSVTRGPLTGKRACIITDAGGPGVMLSDELNRQQLELPVLSKKTQERLRQLLPPESSKINPIDCLPSRTPAQVREIFKILAEEEQDTIDIIVILTGDPGLSDNWEVYQEILKGMAESPIPIIPVLSSAISCRQQIDRFRRLGKIYFPDEVQVGTALGKVAHFNVPEDGIPDISRYSYSNIERILTDTTGVLSPSKVYDLLKWAGFQPALQQIVQKRKDLFQVCESVGYPLVMKVIGPLHKSDLGGVKIGIKNKKEAEKAWRELKSISGATGVLVQKMIEGTEVILGAAREEGYGHLILFGLGGIYTEILKDVQFALAPLTHTESMRMIRSIKGLSILEGARGGKGVSLDLLVDYLMRIAKLVTDFPMIKEIEMNPVKGVGEDLYVVDARVIVEPNMSTG
jgi:acyl-CoA synthetase (NDP forming)